MEPCENRPSGPAALPCRPRPPALKALAEVWEERSRSEHGRDGQIHAFTRACARTSFPSAPMSLATMKLPASSLVMTIRSRKKYKIKLQGIDALRTVCSTNGRADSSSRVLVLVLALVLVRLALAGLLRVLAPGRTGGCGSHKGSREGERESNEGCGELHGSIEER